MEVTKPTADVPDWRIRACPNCGGEREHEVTVRIQQEVTRKAVQPQNQAFARQPYRLLSCIYCGDSRREKVV